LAALIPLGDATETLNDGKGTLRICKGGTPLIDITRAPVKSHARMRNKLESADDHRDKPRPRPKWNVDTVRAGVIVHDAAQIRAVYEAIEAHVVTFLRVKNAFADGAAVNYGYRAILGNLRLESGLTVQRVFGGAHRDTWAALGEARTAIEKDASRHVQRCRKCSRRCSWTVNTPNCRMPRCPTHRSTSRRRCSSSTSRTSTKGVRKLSHLPYKVVRCQTAAELARDAGGKRHTAAAQVKAAERACMGIVMRCLSEGAGGSDS
jgi:hypothetical protein